MAGLGFDDARYLEFPFGECPMDKANTDGDADERCDLSGEPLYDAPKWNATVSPSLRIPFASIPLLRDLGFATVAGVDLLGGLTGEYQDVHFTARSDDPRTRQPSFFRFAADAGIGSASQGWTARVAVKNLTNEAVAVQSRDVTLGQGSFVHVLDEPRLVLASFEWRW